MRRLDIYRTRIKQTLIAFAVSVAALPVAALYAQNVGPTPNGAGIFGPPIATKGAHVQFGNGAAPTINAACGTSPVAPVGTDAAFHFTSGTSATATCAITPAVAHAKAPTVVISPSAAYSVSSAGVITLSGVASSTAYNVLVIDQPGGM